MMRRSAVVIGLVVCAVVSLQGQERTADEQPVRQLIQTLGSALNARDYGAAAAVFADDGDLMMPRSRRASGQPAIRALWQESWAGAPAQNRITITVRSLRFLGPDVAIADVTAEFTAGQPSRDRATYVLVRRGGSWKIAALRVMEAEAP
jgi:uncharacterized protein (TIGR02246 family)